jgi:hypothetical protein
MPPRAPRVHPQQALAVYAEPLAAGRRVVVFADPATGLRERLEDLGADTVVLLTPGDDLEELRAARFDLAIIPDLALFDDPAALLVCVRRVLGDTGAALVAAPNRDAGEAPDTGALDYYALFDLVAREFADVRMIAQLPFHGVALAEVGDEDESPAVSVDTQLADVDRAPEAFVALASQRGTSLDPYAIVELPAPAPAVLDAGELDATRAQLDATSARLDETRAQLDAARVELHDTRTQLEEERLRVQGLMALRAQAARAIELEHELGARARQLAELSSEVEEMRSAAEAGRIAAAQVEELAKRADRAERAERARAHAEPELAQLVEAHAVELLGFEETLRERAQAIRLLEVEVTRRERMVLDLVGALEEHAAHAAAHAPVHVPAAASAAPPILHDASTEAALVAENARLHERLDALALELARREGESQASAWTIAELERKLVAGPPAAPPASAAPNKGTGPAATAASIAPRLAAALDELDALRHALAQEHDARTRAESGEELKLARAEIAKQATLLEQLGQKLALAANASRGEELR